MSDPFEEKLDSKISQLLSGAPNSKPGAQSVYERLAGEILRVRTAERPGLSAPARARGLAELRQRAAQKRRSRLGPWVAIRRTPRWLQVASLVILIILITNGLSVASASSLPGSPLYPLKRWKENGALLMAPSAAVRAQLWMDLANRRLDEVRRLIAAGQPVEESTLQSIDESLRRAFIEIGGTQGLERVDLIQALAELALRQQTTLEELAARAAPEARAQFEMTARRISDVAQTAGGANGSPFETLTPTVTSTTTTQPSLTPTLTPSPTWTPTSAPTQTRVPIGPPTAKPVPTLTQLPVTPLPVAPTKTVGPPQNPTAGPQKTETAEPERTETDEPQQNPTAGPQKTETDDPEKGQTDTPHKTQTPGQDG